MIKKLRLAGAALAATLLLYACDETRVFEENKDIPDYAWHKDSVMHFEVPIADAQQPYNIYYNIRNALSYPAQNLYLQIEIADTTGRVIASDLNNIELFDRQTGKPFGDGLGDMFDHQIPVYKGFTFPHPGRYDVRIQHKMRDKQMVQQSKLPYVMSVGVRVEKAAEGEEANKVTQ